MTGLDDILSGAPTEEPRTPARSPDPDPAREREPSPPVNPAPPPGEAIADFRRQSADDPEDGAAPPAAPQDADFVPVAALKDERKKRQESERLAKEYADKLSAYEKATTQAPAPPPPQRPDLFENPDGALDFVQQQFQRDLDRRILNMSVAAAKRAFPDYADAEAAFVEAVHANPRLYDQMMADEDPAGFAYRVGSQVKVLREVGADPSAYREKVRREVEAELQSQRETEQPLRRADPRSSIPPSLAGGRDSSGRFVPAWNGPESLKDILAPAKK